MAVPRTDPSRRVTDRPPACVQCSFLTLSSWKSSSGRTLCLGCEFLRRAAMAAVFLILSAAAASLYEQERVRCSSEELRTQKQIQTI